MPVRRQTVEGQTVAVENVVRSLVQAPGITDEAPLDRAPGLSGGEDPVDEMPASKRRLVRTGELFDQPRRQKLDAERLGRISRDLRIARLR